ncbi:MAG: large conductance mechanosensitive channel protein MscL [Gemmatimonadota bacterium]
MLKEFRDFVTRGNVLDLAVAVMIGAAFGKIVDSLVNDVLMPPIGLILGRIDFSKLFIPLDGQQYATLEEAIKAEAPLIKYGAFLNNLISFMIVAFTIFLLIKQVQRFRKPALPPNVSEKQCVACCLMVPLKATRCPHCTSNLQPA